jgi:hypothetical protein
MYRENLINLLFLIGDILTLQDRRGDAEEYFREANNLLEQERDESGQKSSQVRNHWSKKSFPKK